MLRFFREVLRERFVETEKPMIAIVDYGMANLRSVEKALQRVGGDAKITSDPDVIARAEKVVLPGVGAFCAAMSNLQRSGLQEAVMQHIRSGKPFLGICLGLQMLFEESTEMGTTSGLGVLPGRVRAFFEDGGYSDVSRLKVPHIGWNALHLTRPSKLLCGLQEGDRVYFVHSYFPCPADPSVVIATSTYGEEFCCAVEKENVAATQFHPEKSGAVGLRILQNFVNW
ncbi:imidazole glycerol phosphate synthase subunit hisH [Chthonomonas calidirosea]|uniref:Imidazole glycerol phosphate synthase subunit HisH n=2 Tax=Chthonomonas TaxID=1077265 RepID=S0EX40_CHTCT|nr:imidazole glycerol phosphate synthase subunit hisH [Chthonomonas calidirosea T49]CEK17599.1 imidazole glycerol phosphate synthase subunit hisH [Chthonomonas calidirosea]CEK18636.1 imidazole glycerol phosphate synthase subunit hisH [Chthonomonas calidirosea]